MSLTNYFERLFISNNILKNCTTSNSVLDLVGTNEPNPCSNFRIKLLFLVYLKLLRPKGKSTIPVNLLSNLPKSLLLILFLIWKSIPGTTCKKYKYGQILLNQKLPGELEMAFTTAISSSSLFVAGKRQKTKPSEKMTRRRRPHKLMETWLHFLFLSF